MQGTPRRWVLWLVGLYLASGLPYGIINELVPVWLKVAGVSLAQIGLASLLGLPWTLKVFWAPLVDRFGATASWIVGAGAVVALGTALAPLLPLGPATACALLGVAIASATQDVAIDGYTAAALPERLHGRANGVRVAAYRGAMLLAGGGGVALAAWLPWRAVFGGLAVLAIALAAVLGRLHEAPRAPQPVSTWLSELARWLARPGALPLFALILLFKLGDAAMAPMVKPFWLDAGLSVAEVGLISTTLGTACTVGGALLGGEIATRIGLYRALWVLGGVQAVTNLGYAAVALWPSRPGIYAASMAESLGNGLGTAAFLAFLMRVCEGEQTATRFALLTALAGLTRTLAGAASGYGAGSWGYPAYFAFTFALALPAFGLLPAARARLGRA